MCGNLHKIYSIVSDVSCVECLPRWIGVLHFRDVLIHVVSYGRSVRVHWTWTTIVVLELS